MTVGTDAEGSEPTIHRQTRPFIVSPDYASASRSVWSYGGRQTPRSVMMAVT